MTRYPRDMRGHGPHPPDPHWPGGARIAVQVVLNYEEGGENCLLHGDSSSEAFLSDIPGATPWEGERHWNMESVYEYGARAGFWRLHRLFTGAGIPVTVYGVATALARAPEQVAAMTSAEWEIACHGLKWIEHRDMLEDEEARQIDAAVALHEEVTGELPRGWYTGRCSTRTVRLAARTGRFAYLSDCYDDDLPYWRRIDGRDQLMIPYTLEANDMRFAASPGWVTGRDFGDYLIDTFDTLYAEGQAGAPKMMSVGLHCRLVGRPGKIAGLRRFIEHVQGHERVWCARRIDVAEHWARVHPPVDRERPSEMDRETFVARFGSVFEHSPWVAERAHALELGPAHDCAAGVHNALCRAFRRATPDERRAVLTAHPDLAGKLAAAGRLTPESTAEQAGAGLDRLTDEARAAFQEMNTKYMKKHGFPFIIAVRDHDTASIRAALERRIANDSETEFAEACRQVERIAGHRLRDMLP